MENWLTKRVLLSPNQKALVYQEQSWTFSELQKEVLKVASQLNQLDVLKKAPIAVLGGNSAKLYFLILALQQLGHPIVFLNHRLTANEITHQLKDAKVAKVVYQEEFTDSIEGLDLLWQEKALSFRQLKKLPEKECVPISEFDLDEVTSIMYTSGTTGLPKGVQQTFNNHWWSAMGSALNLGLSEKDSWLCPVPLFHISGFSIMMRSLIYGMPVYLFATFDEEEINRYLISGEGKMISVVSVMLKRLLVNLGAKNYHPDFRCLLLGGGPIDVGTLTMCQQHGIPVIQSYGMTETASQVVALNMQMAEEKIGSSGLPLFPVELKIVTENQEKCAPYEHGEILLKAPNITKGYLHQPAFKKTDWFHTGDVGYLDQDGYLFIVSRLTDIIISGGENIYPAEVEHVLLEFPGVQDVAVIGIQDADWEQVPVAYVVLSEGQIVDQEQMKAFCRIKLAHYKIPKKFMILKELPRNAAGKIMRHKLIK
ncbi:o-succinylbenzoate--CoA ligase [Carnobacterium gallinarum]|uniref:o-succinylbenzoate--CoA ligase n=1 Tax=Carnobacterium gallinarum TaxID=2749 RepID=UPI000558CF28|nr:o-succinylbenzoate--CoA ligase [Carnobacterium gallinarum]